MALAAYPRLLEINVSRVCRDTRTSGREAVVQAGHIHHHRCPEPHPWQTRKQASKPGAD